MKITIYELLVLIKDGKAPKKIKYDGDIYFLESDAIYEFFTYKTIDYDKFNTDGKRIGKALFLDDCYMHLYSEVEILDEEPKPITKESIEAIGYACGEIRKCFENGWNKSLENKPLIEEDKKIEKLNNNRYIGTDISIIDDMFDKINELIDKVNKLI